MRHIHFSSAAELAAAIPAVADRTPPTPETLSAREAVDRTTESFLDVFLRESGTSPRSWNPPPSPLLHVVALPGKPAPDRNGEAGGVPRE